MNLTCAGRFKILVLVNCLLAEDENEILVPTRIEVFGFLKILGIAGLKVFSAACNLAWFGFPILTMVMA
jgi:hypothetical protein